MGVGIVLLILAICVAAIVVSTSVLKLHPFLSLLLVSVLAGFLFGLSPPVILKTLAEGFGGILAYIGIVIVLGSVLGEMLEKSGAAHVIADALMKGFGKKNPALALSAMGAIVGIPVFCDTGFIILSKLSKTIARKHGLSMRKLSVALAGGLYTTHTLVPPTPGPIAAAGNLGGAEYLGLIMLLGFALTVPILLISYLFIRTIKFEATDHSDEDQTLQELLDVRDLSLAQSVFPIALPILLIAIGTILRLAGMTGGSWETALFFTQPVVALLLAVLFAFFSLKLRDVKLFSQLTASGVAAAGPVLIITGAGGAFGAILRASGLAERLEDLFTTYDFGPTALIIGAFVLASILKTAQGSSTSAIVITSSLLSPFLPLVGIEAPIEIALMVMAIGGGAMTLSHANDSYFWVVSQFGGLNVKDAYRSYSLMTAIQGVVTLVFVLLISQWVG